MVATELSLVLVDIGCRSERLIWIFGGGLFLLNVVTRLQASITKCVREGCFSCDDAGSTWITGGLDSLESVLQEIIAFWQNSDETETRKCNNHRFREYQGCNGCVTTTHAYSAMKGWIQKLFAVQGHIVT